jgi:hypothetical protein
MWVGPGPSRIRLQRKAMTQKIDEFFPSCRNW